MEWRQGVLTIALALAIGAGAGPGLGLGAPGSARAAEPGAAFYTFEGRDYLMVWPNGPPSGVLIFLHTLEAAPLRFEARDGMIDALGAYAAAEGFVLLAPSAAVTTCDAPGTPASARLACWKLDAAAAELGYVARLVRATELNQGVSFRDREAIGYGRGADLLTAGFAETRLAGYRKIGLLAGEQPVDSLPSAGPVLGDVPTLYIEAAEGDASARRHTADLLRNLVNAGYGNIVCARGDAGNARYDYDRTAAFLAWFANDCGPDASPAASLAPAGPAAPSGQEVAGNRAPVPESEEETRRRPLRWLGLRRR